MSAKVYICVKKLTLNYKNINQLNNNNMKKNVYLEFISKVRKLSRSMQELSDFWQSNLEVLEGLNVSKGYPFNESLDDLTVSLEDTNECENYPFNESFEELTNSVFNWRLMLIIEYYKSLLKL